MLDSMDVGDRVTCERLAKACVEGFNQRFHSEQTF